MLTSKKQPEKTSKFSVFGTIYIYDVRYCDRDSEKAMADVFPHKL